MAALQDCSIGFGVESTYKTYATPTRWPEFVEESLGWEKTIVQSSGLRVGSRVARSNRRVIPAAAGSGDVTLEAFSKGMGIILRAALGGATSTLVSGSTYQQVFTLGTSSPSSLTVQKGLVRADGTVDAYSFLGGMVADWEFSCPNKDIARFRFGFDFGNIDVAQTYVAPSYPSGGGLYHFGGAQIYTGTLTAPTTTTLASATGSVAGVRSFSVSNNNNPDVDRFNANATGRKDKPTQGVVEIGGSMDVEYASTDFRDAVLNDSPMCAIFHFETPNTLSTGVETLQIVLPEIKFDNELAKANGGNLILQSMNFMGLDNSTAAQPIWVVLRTADTAL